jgi:hypothetical protein
MPPYTQLMLERGQLISTTQVCLLVNTREPRTKHPDLAVAPGLSHDPRQRVHSILPLIHILGEPALTVIPPSAVLHAATRRLC